MSTDGIAIDTGRHTVSIVRTYRTSVERAWWAWTDPDAIARWWGPTGWTATVHEMDVRPGGRWRFELSPDEGSAETVRGIAVYAVVDTARVLAFDDAFADDMWEPDGTGTFPTRVSFTPLAAACRVEVEAAFADDEALRRAVDMHMADGYAEALHRLAHLLEPRKETHP